MTALVAPIVGTLEWAVLGWPLFPPWAFAAFLLALAFAADRWERPVAFCILPLCLVPPLGAISAYLSGEHSIWLIPVFDTLLLGWLFWRAMRATLQPREQFERAP